MIVHYFHSIGNNGDLRSLCLKREASIFTDDKKLITCTFCKEKKRLIDLDTEDYAEKRYKDWQGP